MSKKKKYVGLTIMGSVTLVLLYLLARSVGTIINKYLNPWYVAGISLVIIIILILLGFKVAGISKRKIKYVKLW